MASTSGSRQDPSFGMTLKQFRMAAGFSQEELASRAGLSVRGISDLERGVKTRPHFETVRMLADALALDPPQRAALLAAARPTAAVVAAQPFPASDWPVPLTSLIGRETSVAMATALLRDGSTRLLTMTGPGGVGKTRLAIRVASELRDDFADGAAFVPLAAIAEPQFVLPTIARSLGLRELPGQPPHAAIGTWLEGKQLLLVLDNFEHVRTAAPDIAGLLATAPGVAILTTSRAPLRLQGEQLFPVPPLSLPSLRSRHEAGEIQHAAALALFEQRARAVQPGFRLDGRNLDLVADICMRLDGLPLAIELAANRLRILSLPELHALLSARLRLLTDGSEDAPVRQRSLRAAISSSYDLLEPHVQALFRRLSVFSGGWKLEAASAISGATDVYGALEAMQALVDHALVTRLERSDGDTRFTMLETIREFADELLRASDEDVETRRKHVLYYRDVAEQAETALSSATRAAWMTYLEDEYANLREALIWSIEAKESEAALRLGSALWPFWAASGRLVEGYDWLRRALDVNGAVASGTTANALLRLGNLAVDLADYPAARVRYEASLAASEQVDDARGRAAALTGLGLVAMSEGAYSEAQSLFMQALELWQRLNNQRGIALTRLNLGNVAIAQGDYAAALAEHESGLQSYLEGNDTAGAAYSTFWLGQLARLEGRLADARRLLLQSIRAFHNVRDRLGFAYSLHELGRLAHDEGRERFALAYFRRALAVRRQNSDLQGTIDCIEGIALVASAIGRHEESAMLLAMASAWREAHTAPAIPPLHAGTEGAAMVSRRALGEPAFEAAWRRGGQMTTEQAVALALRIRR